jgi:hypothetical protein
VRCVEIKNRTLVSSLGRVVLALGTIAWSKITIGEVRSESDCDLVLTPEQLVLTPEQKGEAQNFIFGETASWQQGKPVFHWLCDGVVARIDSEGTKRADRICRTCVPCVNQATVLNYKIGGAVSPSDY